MNMPPLPRLLDEGLSSPPSDISSPPSSPPQNAADSITVSQRRSFGEGVVHPASATSAQPAAAQNGAAHHTNAAVPATSIADAKPKRQRKAPAPKDGKAPEPVKEKKPRKPREPKVKKDGEAAPAAASRKRQKTEDKTTPAAADAPTGVRQPLINEMMLKPAPAPNTTSQQIYQPQPQPPPLPSLPSAPSPLPAIPSDATPRSSLPPHTAHPPPPRPYSSGQNYDPIRGSTIDSASRPAAATTNGALSAQASPRINRASASPSIISLIDPAPTTKTSAPQQMSYPSQTTMQQPQPLSFVGSQQPPTPPRPASVPQPAVPVVPSQSSPTQKPRPTTMDGAMDLDGPDSEPPPTQAPQIKAPSKPSSSTAPTPKPVAAKANSPPKATGSGLLSSSDLFGGPSTNQGAERKGIDIEIIIKLNPNGGNTINLAQEIAKKYGRDAINPRAAVHRERLLQVTAAANRLDGGSADDMSVDLMSEVDGDSNVEMGGMDEEKSATGADDKPRKRRKKVEEYDKEDDFIDDTELAWQEQAAVAKDGFFVYSGPLVTAGQDVKADTAAPRGRGGGRGRGRGRAAAAAANGVTHASLAEKKEAGTGRGRGGRGRGTGVPRKPRVTKADRERMEAEKQERMARNTSQATGQMLAPSAQGALSGPPQNTYAHPSAPAQGGVPV